MHSEHVVKTGRRDGEQVRRSQRALVVQSLLLAPGVPIVRPVVEQDLARGIFR